MSSNNFCTVSSSINSPWVGFTSIHWLNFMCHKHKRLIFILVSSLIYTYLHKQVICRWFRDFAKKILCWLDTLHIWGAEIHGHIYVILFLTVIKPCFLWHQFILCLLGEVEFLIPLNKICWFFILGPLVILYILYAHNSEFTTSQNPPCETIWVMVLLMQLISFNISTIEATP
jgi:hypothetical protein